MTRRLPAAASLSPAVLGITAPIASAAPAEHHRNRPVARHGGLRRVRRVSLAVATLAIAFLAFAPAASANTVIHGQYVDSATLQISGVCAFPFTLNSVAWINETDNIAKDGSLVIAWTARGQSTYSANGRTLVGEPATSRMTAVLDPEGNLVGGSIAGVIEKVRLPDGTVFISAGLIRNPSGVFVLAPDRGVSGDVSALCGALAA